MSLYDIIITESSKFIRIQTYVKLIMKDHSLLSSILLMVPSTAAALSLGIAIVNSGESLDNCLPW